MKLALDHLVLAARTLGEGVAWCESTLGLHPQAGGQHLHMGTHNRVFGLESEAFPKAYFEIIAIDPNLPAPKRARWFGLDEPGLQRLLFEGPRLVAHATMRAAGIDCGAIEPAERATPSGLLRWQISVRADGRRLLGGAAPALIEWGGAHPSDSMEASGIELTTMRLGAWPDALAELLPPTIERFAAPDAPPLCVELVCPRGLVRLQTQSAEA
jgi:Glyoxalase-like domain